MHYYQKNIGDYYSATNNLSFLEHGIYTIMIDKYMLDEKPFPKDKDKIYFLIGARSQEEKKAVDILLEMFFKETKNSFIHKRCDEEIATYHAKSSKARDSVNVRWEKERTANAIRSYNESNTNHKPITNNQEPITIITNKSKPLSDSRTGEYVSKIENDFDTFWKAYPKKEGKQEAKKHWLKTKPNLETVLQALEWQIKSDKWTEENGKFIPMGRTYVRNARWQDERVLTRAERLSQSSSDSGFFHDTKEKLI